jgi:hypothetical protein
MAINRDLDGIKIVGIDMIASVVIAGFGFGTRKES